MRVYITDTRSEATLTIIDPFTGCDYTADFFRDTEALDDGQFTWDETRQAWRCSQAAFDGWEQVIAANQALQQRIYALTQEHWPEAVYDAILEAGSDDRATHPALVNKALDDAFGALLSPPSKM